MVSIIRITCIFSLLNVGLMFGQSIPAADHVSNYANGSGDMLMFAVPSGKNFFLTDVYITLQSDEPGDGNATLKESSQIRQRYGYYQVGYALQTVIININYTTPIVFPENTNVVINAWFSYGGSCYANISGFIRDNTQMGLGRNDSSSQGIQLTPFPNPSNGLTTIRFEIYREKYVKLEIYNVAGELVIGLVDEKLYPGVHEITWNGKDDAGNLVASGNYFPRMFLDDKIVTTKLVFLK